MANKSVVSIDLGAYQIKVAVGKLQKEDIHIEHAYAIDTPEGSYSDGKVFLDEGKAELLKKSIIESLSQNRIRIKDCIFTIQSTSIIRRELEIPVVKPQEIENMIRFEIEQYLPIDLSEYVVEYKILGDKKEIKENKDSKMKILIAALPKSIADDYLHLIQEMKLDPVALDINSNAVSKLFSYKQEVNNEEYELDKTVALIDLGANSINITIVSGGHFQFSRLIPTGGRELDAAISDAFYVPMQDAEKMKIKEADLKEMPPEVGNSSLNEIIRRIVYRWTEDIQRVFQYYKTRNARNTIDSIYICGGTSNLKGLNVYMANTMNIPTQQIQSVGSIKLGRHTENINLERYLNAIGAIIRK